MNGICIKVCGQQKQMPANSNLEEALRRYSPYGGRRWYAGSTAR